MNLNLDYETRSRCDLIKAGAYAYAAHPSTSVLCAAYKINDGETKYWATLGGVEMPADLRKALVNPKVIKRAWNSQFERLITKHVLGIDVPIRQWQCTAAWARARSLPGRLVAALKFVHAGGDKLGLKSAGSKIMKRWCTPLAMTDRVSPDREWADDWAEYTELVRYCIGDVDSENAIAAKLAPWPMTPQELEDFWVNEEINDRGLPIDHDLARVAARLGSLERGELDRELSDWTMGLVPGTTKTHDLKRYLVGTLPEAVFKRYFTTTVEATDDAPEKVRVSTDKHARTLFLEACRAADEESTGIPDDWLGSAGMVVAQVLEVVDEANKSSVAKYQRMVDMDVGGRAHGAYLYAGAGQTKRYSSKGIQMHNLPRTQVKDIEAAITMVSSGALERDHTTVHGGANVMQTLSSLLRPTICAPEGRRLVWGDWSSVEARGMPWLAGCQWKLDLYRDKVDVYKANAVDIFGIDLGAVTDDQRQIGKVAELSLQFGGAVGALSAMARGYGIRFNPGEALAVVVGWRDANPWAKVFSHGLQQAYVWALLFPSVWVQHDAVKYRSTHKGSGKHKNIMVECLLPGGTTLYYQQNSGLVYARSYAAHTPIEIGRNMTDDALIGKTFTTRQMHRAFFSTLPNRAEGGARNDALVLSLWKTPPGVSDIDRAKMKPAHQQFVKATSTGGYPERIWHGLLAENATQALCAALLRDCLGRVNAKLQHAKLDAAVIGHTHDEIILEAADGAVDAASDLLAGEMKAVPEWLPGYPLGAEIKTGRRYTK